MAATQGSDPEPSPTLATLPENPLRAEVVSPTSVLDTPPTLIVPASPSGADSGQEKRKLNLPFSAPKKLFDKLIPSRNKAGGGGQLAGIIQRNLSGTVLQRTGTHESLGSVNYSPSLYHAGTESGKALRTSVRPDGTISYQRVRSRHKSQRLLNRVFLAQELSCTPDSVLPIVSPVLSSRYAPSVAGSVAEDQSGNNNGLAMLHSKSAGPAFTSPVRSPVQQPVFRSIPGGTLPVNIHQNISSVSLSRSPLASPRLSVSQSRGSLQPSSDAVFSLKFSQSGLYLACGGQSTVIKVWRLRDASQNQASTRNSQENLFTPEAPSVHSTAEPPESTTTGKKEEFASDSYGIFEPKPYREYVGHTRDVLDLAWSKNDFLLSSSMDKTVRLWHISRNECLCCFHHIDFVTSIDFHPRDDRFFLSGSLDGKVRLWNIPEKKVAAWNELPDGHLITAVGFASKEGTLVAAGSHKGLCVFYETDGLKYHTQIQVRSTRGRNARGHKITGIQPIPSASFGEDKLLITSNDSRIRLYNMKDKSLERKYKGHVNHSSQIKAMFSPDGKRIICGSEDHNVYVWDTQPSVVHKTMYQDKEYYTQVPMLLSSGGGQGFKRRDKDQVGVEWFNAGSGIVTTAIFAPTETVHWLAQHGDPLFANQPPLGPSLANSGQSIRSNHSQLRHVPSSLSMSQWGNVNATPEDTSERSSYFPPPPPLPSRPGTMRSETAGINLERANSGVSLPQSGTINHDIIVTAGYDGLIRVYRRDTRSNDDITAIQTLYGPSPTSWSHANSSYSRLLPPGVNQSSFSVHSSIPLGMYRNRSEVTFPRNVSTGSVDSGTGGETEDADNADRSRTSTASRGRRNSTSSRRSHTPSIFEFFGFAKKKERRPSPKPVNTSPSEDFKRSQTVPTRSRASAEEEGITAEPTAASSTLGNTWTDDTSTGDHDQYLSADAESLKGAKAPSLKSARSLQTSPDARRRSSSRSQRSDGERFTLSASGSRNRSSSIHYTTVRRDQPEGSQPASKSATAPREKKEHTPVQGSCPSCASTSLHTFDVVPSQAPLVGVPGPQSNVPTMSPSKASSKGSPDKSVRELIPQGKLTICLACRSVVN
ncbi:WD repeat-containing protein 44 [Dispira parvispora]|uniref:WD repeat-containing protein 44 n=1 Tax=Dispira parvispora TaxID=1520584 RepID=A0A9W8E4Q6_9FUNG|nr:WD repeat-containing protein 44 [Dispira parvispora]